MRSGPPSHLPSTRTKQTTCSLSLTNSNNMLYSPGLIRAPGLSVPASLMRPRHAALQSPPKSSVPHRLPFYKSCPPLTHAQSTLLQLLISLYFNSPRISAYKKLGRWSLLPAPKIYNSLLLPYLLFRAKRGICFFLLPPLPSYLIASLLRISVGVHTHSNASNIFSSQLVARHCSRNSFLCRSFRSLATH
jgi:hypothetical protein